MCLAKRDTKLIFSHALTECDTRSSLFGISKSAAFRHFWKCQEFSICATLFGSENTNRKEHTDIWHKSIGIVVRWKSKDTDSEPTMI